MPGSPLSLYVQRRGQGSDYYNHLQDHNHVYIHHTLATEVKSKRR